MGKITSLRRNKDGTPNRIWLDMPFDARNSGEPVRGQGLNVGGIVDSGMVRGVARLTRRDSAFPIIT
jgi:hypothetical protein